MFVFSPTDTYGPQPAADVTVIEYDEVVEFIHQERWSLRDTVGHWVGRALGDEVSKPGPLTDAAAVILPA